MLGRLSFVVFALLLFGGIAIIALPAHADETYLVGKDFKRANSNIVIHLIEVNVTDRYMGNIYPSKAPEETKWAHLVYQYENTGDREEVGYIQYELIDTNGNVYKFNPNQDEYSGALVKPRSKSELRWNEIPIPKDAVLAKVRVYQGTNPSFLLADETFDLTPVTTTAPSATPSGGPSGTRPLPRCCMPLLPFIVMGSLAIMGIYAKGKGVKK